MAGPAAEEMNLERYLLILPLAVILSCCDLYVLPPTEAEWSAAHPRKSIDPLLESTAMKVVDPYPFYRDADLDIWKKDRNDALESAAEEILKYCPFDWHPSLDVKKHDLNFWGIRGRGTGIRIVLTSVICTFSEGPPALSTTRNCYITIWIMPASFDGVYSGLHPSLPIPQKLGESRDVEVYFTGLEIAHSWPDAPNFFRRLLDLK
jgi:hypothetical protein